MKVEIDGINESALLEKEFLRNSLIDLDFNLRINLGIVRNP